jgi:hypothetical protein
VKPHNQKGEKMNNEIENMESDSKFVVYETMDAPAAMMQWNQEGI